MEQSVEQPTAFAPARPDDRPFELDRFQLDAIAALEEGYSVIVAAPTGSGKTVVAERAVELALAAGRRAFYTAPIKALSNQKYVDFLALHGPRQVGLLTGDNSINSSAPVVVMTTEVLRNMIYTQSDDLANLNWVVLDEVHYLQDPYRGPVWEEILIHAPAGVRFVCLSATVSNVEEIRSWIAALRGSVRSIVETERPVELERLICASEGGRHSPRLWPLLIKGAPNPECRILEIDRRTSRARRGRQRASRRRWHRPDRLKVLEELAGRDMLPAIYFIFSRAGCEKAAAALAHSNLGLTTVSERKRIERVIAPFVATLDEDDRAAVGYDRWEAQLFRGVAAHHAGLLPPFKEATEACFTEGLVKVVFATETLSLGINMPARSVVVEKLSKFTGDAHEPISPAEFTQLMGRAGRRGIDERGYAVVLWHPRWRLEGIVELVQNNSFPLRSAFRPTYNMTANLLARLSPTEARSVLKRSLAQWQVDRDAPKRKRRLLAEEFDNLARVLRRRGLLRGWHLLAGGELLTGVYHECDLLIVEMLLEGHFDNLAPPEMAALLSFVSYESRGKDMPAEPASFPSKSAYHSWLRLGELHESLALEERECLGRSRTREPDGGFAEVAYYWTAGAELLDGVVEDVAAGDFVRNVKRICDLARQIARVAPSSSAALTSRRTIDLMLRGVVASSALDTLES